MVKGIPGHGYKQNTGDLFDGIVLTLFCDKTQVLVAEGIPEGKNEPPTVFELLQQRRRDMIDGSCNHNTIKGGCLRPTEITVCMTGFYVRAI